MSWYVVLLCPVIHNYILMWYIVVIQPFLEIGNTVEPRLVDTPSMWTPHHYGHFSQAPFGFPYTIHLAGVDTSCFTTVNTLLLWTLVARPLGVNIREFLL